MRHMRGHDIAAFDAYVMSQGDFAARDLGALMFTLYSMQRSGNSYKARLALAQLGIPYRLVEIDILKGESHTPEFLTKNPNGQVPLLEVAPGRFLADPTPSSGTSPAARRSRPTIASNAPKRCNGCSSSSTASSRISARPISG